MENNTNTTKHLTDIETLLESIGDHGTEIGGIGKIVASNAYRAQESHADMRRAAHKAADRMGLAEKALTAGYSPATDFEEAARRARDARMAWEAYELHIKELKLALRTATEMDEGWKIIQAGLEHALSL